MRPTRPLSPRVRLGKQIALCLVMALLLSAFPNVALHSFAEAEAWYREIFAGETLTVDRTDGVVYFRFIPNETATYTFFSSGDMDTFACLYDAVGNELLTDDDGGEDGNFFLTYSMERGQTYYFGCRFYGGNSGSYTVTLRYFGAEGGAKVWNTVRRAEIGGCGTYTLFYGAENAYPLPYGYTQNAEENSPDNFGYDLYADANVPSIRQIVLGLGFTMGIDTDEKALLYIRAFDVREEDGERACVRLVDETSTEVRTVTSFGSRDHLYGTPSAWSTTVFAIDPALLIKGHSYHLELEEASVGTSVCIRSVLLQINGETVPLEREDGISDAELFADIDGSGTVYTTLHISSLANEEFIIEYQAETVGAQSGAKTAPLLIYTSGVTQTLHFALDSGAPEGIYRITAYVFHRDGRLAKTVSCFASGKSGTSAITYHANGGSENLPTDTATYAFGESAKVKFDFLPSRSGYVFSGWSTDRNGFGAIYTPDGENTFTVGKENVTLYAVWRVKDCAHRYLCTRTEPTCTASGWDTFLCELCKDTYRVLVPALGHQFADGVCTRCGEEEHRVDFWDGSTDTTWYREGQFIFTLETAEQLAGLAELVNDGNTFAGITIRLGVDMDLSGHNWIPIGKGIYSEKNMVNAGAYFAGIFDGGYHVIRHLTVSEPSGSSSGLFGNICGGSVCALGLEDVSVSVYQKSLFRFRSGALAGAAEDLSLTDCYMTGTVSTHCETNCDSGGLIGTAFGHMTLKNCYALVDATAGSCAGGLIGGLYNASDVWFRHCYAVGNILVSGIGNSAEYCAGGYAGYTRGLISFASCFFVGTMTVEGHERYAYTHLYRNASIAITCFHSCALDGAVDSSYFRLEKRMRENLGWDFDEEWWYTPTNAFPSLRGFGGTEGLQDTHEYLPTEFNYLEPTCTQAGRVYCYCMHCHDGYYEELPALGHENALTERVEPSCVEDGKLVYFCTRCGNIETAVLPANGHRWNEETTYVSPTCTQDGYSFVLCKECGLESRTAEPNTALGHDERYASNGDGTHTRYCGRCDEKHKEECVFTKCEVLPTPTELGYVLRTCEICLGSLRDSFCVYDRLSFTEESALRVDRDAAILALVKENMTWGELSSCIENVYGTVRAFDRDGNEITSATATVGTGTYICLEIEGRIADRLNVVLRGDLNGDGCVTQTDYLFLARHLSGRITLEEKTVLDASDTDGDGTVTQNDLCSLEALLNGKLVLYV